MRAIAWLVSKASDILLWLSGILLVMMMLHIVADVLLKYLFHWPIPATIQVVAWYYMVGVAFLPVAWAQLRKSHLIVELFTVNLPPRTIAFIDGCVEVAALAYTGLLAKLLFGNAVKATTRRVFQDATFFDLPTWPAAWFPAVAFALMAVVVLLQAIVDFHFAFTGRRLVELNPDAQRQADAPALN